MDKLGCKNEWWTASRPKGEKVNLADVETAAYDASVQRRALGRFDPFQAVQLGQNVKKRGRQVCAPFALNYLLNDDGRCARLTGGEQATSAPPARRPDGLET